MFKNTSASVVGFVAFIAILLAAIYGYGANIMALINMMNSPITGEFIIRGIGIFVFPLGIIMGLFY